MNSGYEVILQKILNGLPSMGIIIVAVIMLTVWVGKVGMNFRKDLDAVKADIIRILIKLGLHEGTPEDEKNVVASKRDFTELEAHILEIMNNKFRPIGECRQIHNGIKEHIEILDKRIDRKADASLVGEIIHKA